MLISKTLTLWMTLIISSKNTGLINIQNGISSKTYMRINNGCGTINYSVGIN